MNKFDLIDLCLNNFDHQLKAALDAITEHYTLNEVLPEKGFYIVGANSSPTRLYLVFTNKEIWQIGECLSILILWDG